MSDEWFLDDAVNLLSEVTPLIFVVAACNGVATDHTTQPLN